MMEDFKSITVTKGQKALEIDNPTTYPLIGQGAQGAVFKLSEDQCVKIYIRPCTSKNGKRKPFKQGSIYPFAHDYMNKDITMNVMEYFNAPTLKEYLRNCTYIPESIAKKLLSILEEIKKQNSRWLMPLYGIFLLLKMKNLK